MYHDWKQKNTSQTESADFRAPQIVLDTGLLLDVLVLSLLTTLICRLLCKNWPILLASKIVQFDRPT